MRNAYYEVEYYHALLGDIENDDDYFEVLRQDPDVEEFLSQKEHSTMPYETILENEDPVEFMEENEVFFTTWETVRAILAGDTRIFEYSDYITINPFSLNMMFFAGGLSGSTEIIDLLFQFGEDHDITFEDGWGPMMIAIVEVDDIDCMSHLYDEYLEDTIDDPYFDRWSQLAKRVAKEHGSKKCIDYLQYF